MHLDTAKKSITNYNFSYYSFILTQYHAFKM